MSFDELPPRPKEAIPLLSDGPFAGASFPWQITPPTDARVVVVKCTLAIVPGGVAEPLEEQDFPCGDVFHDDDPHASLRYASDFAPFKPRADVMMVGHAHPRRAGDRTASVQLAFGRDLRRAIAAIGDRRWSEEAPSIPAPFTRIPLRFERAFGGAGDSANPYGIGRAGLLLPNLEQPDALVRSPGDRPAPACFAPLAATLIARAGKLGTYDQAWLRERWPYFPRDVDWAYFNAADASQQIPYPRGDEAFSLAGVHPELAVINGRLPGLTPRAFAVTPSTREKHREIPLQLDTVWFDADAMRVALVWRGRLDVSAEHAPEIAALFVTTSAPGLDAAAVDQRFTAKVVALHGHRAARVDADRARGDEKTVHGASGTVHGGEKTAHGGAGTVHGGEKTAHGGAGTVHGGEMSAQEPAIAVPAAMTRDEVIAKIAAPSPLPSVDLTGCDLSGLDLRGRDLTGAILTGANLEGARFDGAHLTAAVLARVSGRGASFTGADLRGANLVEARLPEADFTRATLDDASLADASLDHASFRDAKLSRANLTDARLTASTFDGATAIAADLSGAALPRASLRGAILDDAQMYGADAEGAAFDGASMARFRADDARLTSALFLDAKAPSSSFEAANLEGASFHDANLDGSVFNHTNLERAVLSRATAKGARFRHARMVRVNALRANLMEANFEGADLTQADLRGSNLHGAETLKAKLDGVKLDQALVTGSKLAG